MTNITASGNKVLIDFNGQHTMRYSGPFNYGFVNNELRLNFGGERITIPFASLQVGGVAPANVATALTALDAVFLSPVGAGLTTYSRFFEVTGSQVDNPSNVAINITGLRASVLAGRRYEITGCILTGCNNSGGLQIGYSGPAGSSVISGTFIGSSTAGNVVQSVAAAAMGSLTGSTAFNRVNAQTGMIDFRTGILIGATAGNIDMQFASATNGQTSTIRLTSWMKIIEMY